MLGGTSAMHHSGTKVNLSIKAIRQFLKPFRHEVMFECGNFSPLLLLICIHLTPGKRDRTFPLLRVKKEADNSLRDSCTLSTKSQYSFYIPNMWSHATWQHDSVNNTPVDTAFEVFH